VIKIFVGIANSKWEFRGIAFAFESRAAYGGDNEQKNYRPRRTDQQTCYVRAEARGWYECCDADISRKFEDVYPLRVSFGPSRCSDVVHTWDGGEALIESHQHLELVSHARPAPERSKSINGL
jgi:hypothetical protein